MVPRGRKRPKSHTIGNLHAKRRRLPTVALRLSAARLDAPALREGGRRVRRAEALLRPGPRARDTRALADLARAEMRKSRFRLAWLQMFVRADRVEQERPDDQGMRGGVRTRQEDAALPYSSARGDLTGLTTTCWRTARGDAWLGGGVQGLVICWIIKPGLTVLAGMFGLGLARSASCKQGEGLSGSC